MKNSTWSGRFSKELDNEVLEFSESISVDFLLFETDIRVSIAHAEMLGECKIISKKESKTLVSGLKKVLDKYTKGKLSLNIKFEDVHMNIEQALIKEIGELGKKIHMGRSRNDLVATDLRIYLRDCTDVMVTKLRDTRYALAICAGIHSDTIFPGYTHLQLAQPVTFGHHLLAWHEMLSRDEERLVQSRDRMNVLPLGSAALSGTPYPIDRDIVAKQLGFDSVSSNSMDAVSDRDFVCDVAYCCSMLMTHLSRISEELVFWMNPHIGLVDIDEAFCTGSSIMPQKKNPDVAELIRGKASHSIGQLISILTLLKGLPLTYNRDLQEDKTIIFESIRNVLSCLSLLPRLILTLEVDKDKALTYSKQDFSNATDLADYLTKKGVPFRTSHEITGKIVKYAESKSMNLNELSLEQLNKYSSLIGPDVFKAIDVEKSLSLKSSKGSSSPANVRKEVRYILKSLKKFGYE